MAKDLEVKLRITADGKVAVEQLGNVDAALGSVDQAAEQAGGALGSFVAKGEVWGKLALGFNELGEALGTVLGPLQDIATLAGEYQDLAARVRLVSESSAASAEAMAELGRVAQESHAPLAELGDLYVKVANAAKGSGASQAEMLGFTQAISDALLVSGTSAQAAAGAMTQLAQGLASGALRGDEFNSVAESMPPLMDAIAKHLGMSRGELRAYAAEGKITADVVRAAVAGMADTWREAAERMPATIGRAMTDLTSAFQQFVGESSLVAGSTRALAEAMGSVATHMQELGELAGEGAVLALSMALGRAAQGAKQWAADQIAATAATRAANAETLRAAALHRDYMAAKLAAAAATTKSLRVLAEEQPYLLRTQGYHQRLTAALQAERAARDGLTAATVRHTAALAAGAAPAGLLAAGLAKARVAAAGLGTAFSTIGWGLIIAELFDIGKGVAGIISQYRELERIRREQASTQGAIEGAVAKNLRDLADAANTAILSEQRLAELSREEADAYLLKLNNAARYWAAVATQAKQAGELAREADAEQQANRYAQALSGLKGRVDELIASQARLSPVAQALLETFDAMAQKGTGAAQSIQTLVGSLRFDSAAEAMVNVDAVLQLVARLGSASEEAGEQVRATARDIREGLAPALDKLSGESLRNFAAEWRKAMDAFDLETLQTTAAVMDVVLGAALRKLKLDLTEIRTGATATGREMVAAFEAAAIAAQGLAEAPAIIRQAFEAAAAAAKSTADVEALRVALVRLGSEGRIGADQVARGLEDLNYRLGAIAVQTREVEQAFRDLGINSSESVRQAALRARQAFEEIRDSEATTLEDRQRAWEAYATKAVESGDRVIISAAREEAAVLGQIGRLDELVAARARAGEAAKGQADAEQQVAEQTERAADASEDLAAANQAVTLTFEDVLQAAGQSAEELGRYASVAKDVWARGLPEAVAAFNYSVSSGVGSSRDALTELALQATAVARQVAALDAQAEAINSNAASGVERLRERLIELTGTEKQLAEFRERKERLEIERQMLLLDIQVRRAELEGNSALADSLREEIALYREQLALLKQVQEAERARAAADAKAATGASATPAPAAQGFNVVNFNVEGVLDVNDRVTLESLGRKLAPVLGDLARRGYGGLSA